MGIAESARSLHATSRALSDSSRCDSIGSRAVRACGERVPRAAGLARYIVISIIVQDDKGTFSRRYGPISSRAADHFSRRIIVYEMIRLKMSLCRGIVEIRLGSFAARKTALPNLISISELGSHTP